MASPPMESMKNIAQELGRIIEQEENGALALVVRATGSTPGGVGAKMLVLPDGSIRGTVGGGVLEARVISDALNAIEDGKGPRTVHYKLDELGMSCGGEMSLYLEPIVAPRRVFIYGGGHVGAAIAKVLSMLGCRTVVADDREEWANRERFPDAEEIINKPYAEAIAARAPGPRDHVIIVTRGHEHDFTVLEALVGRKLAYLGMIGSKKKAQEARERLKGKNVSEEQIQFVRSPVGLDIGAVTPEEIAVSVAAELIFLWRRGPGGEGKSGAGRAGRDDSPKAPAKGGKGA